MLSFAPPVQPIGPPVLHIRPPVLAIEPPVPLIWHPVHIHWESSASNRDYSATHRASRAAYRALCRLALEALQVVLKEGPIDMFCNGGPMGGTAGTMGCTGDPMAPSTTHRALGPTKTDYSTIIPIQPPAHTHRASSAI